MSDMREAFEKTRIIPADANYDPSANEYRYRDYPGVAHPINEMYESFMDGYDAALKHAGRVEQDPAPPESGDPWEASGIRRR